MHVLFQSWVHLILIQRMHPDRVQREVGADLPVDVAGERRTTGIWIAYRPFWLKSRRKDEPLLTFTFLYFVSVVDLESPRPEHLQQNTFILTRADAGPQQNHITSWNIKEWSGHQRPTQTFVSHYHIPPVRSANSYTCYSFAGMAYSQKGHENAPEISGVRMEWRRIVKHISCRSGNTRWSFKKFISVSPWNWC